MSIESDKTPIVHVVQSPKWIRGFINGEKLVDTKRALILRQPNKIPIYYFHRDDIGMDFLERSDTRTDEAEIGDVMYWNIGVGTSEIKSGAWSHTNIIQEGSQLNNHIAFEWDTMDAWYEEDEEIFVHARDPYKRIDSLPSSRHIKIVVGGVMVAESRSSVLLFETGLPTRYYIPKLDVDTKLLVPSTLTTQCPYKGEARYYSVSIGETMIPDIAWYYPYPLIEVVKITGMLCFFNERVDSIFVDGHEIARPKTPWSTPDEG